MNCTTITDQFSSYNRTYIVLTPSLFQVSSTHSTIELQLAIGQTQYQHTLVHTEERLQILTIHPDVMCCYYILRGSNFDDTCPYFVQSIYSVCTYRAQLQHGFPKQLHTASQSFSCHNLHMSQSGLHISHKYCFSIKHF